MPFSRFWVNQFIAGYFTSFCIMSIICFFHFLEDGRIILALIIIIWIIAGLIWHYIFYLMTHKIISFSTLPNSFFSYLNPRFIHFFTPDLISSEELNEIILQYSDNSIILFQIAQIACIFPDYSEIFSKTLPLLLNFENLSIAQQYMKFELVQAVIGRNNQIRISKFSTISDYSKEFSHAIIASLHELQKKDTLFSPYRIIDDITSKRIYLHDYWSNLIRIYPKNVQLMKHYISFLIQCESNFMKVSKIKSKLETIETAFNSDLVFIHYANVYPQYASRVLKYHYSNSEEIKYKNLISFQETLNNMYSECEFTIHRDFQYILKKLNFKYTVYFSIFTISKFLISIIILSFFYFYYSTLHCPIFPLCDLINSIMKISKAIIFSSVSVFYALSGNETLYNYSDYGNQSFNFNVASVLKAPFIKIDSSGHDLVVQFTAEGSKEIHNIPIILTELVETGFLGSEIIPLLYARTFPNIFITSDSMEAFGNSTYFESLLRFFSLARSLSCPTFGTPAGKNQIFQLNQLHFDLRSSISRVTSQILEILEDRFSGLRRIDSYNLLIEWGIYLVIILLELLFFYIFQQYFKKAASIFMSFSSTMIESACIKNISLGENISSPTENNLNQAKVLFPFFSQLIIFSLFQTLLTPIGLSIFYILNGNFQNCLKDLSWSLYYFNIIYVNTFNVWHSLLSNYYSANVTDNFRSFYTH
jgi:hypothetical protein